MQAEYPAKHYADFTTADRTAMRRYEQGRTDLIGVCPHYDAGFDAEATA